MKWFGHFARTALLALLAWPAAAFAQGTSAAPAPAPAGAPAATAAGVSTGPSFQSGGIKVTVTSLAGKANHVAISVLLENRGKENLLVAVIGPPLGVNGGAAYSPEAIGGIASCIYNPHNDVVKSLDRALEISGCLKDDKPQLTPDTFTLIEAGNAVPMNVAFGSGDPIDVDKGFSFSMNLATFKESDLASDESGGALAAKNKVPTLPKSLRYLSVGITSLPFDQK
jgi:hypothetical protein